MKIVTLVILATLTLLLAAIATGARCDPEGEDLVLPRGGADLALLASGEAFLSATGEMGDEYSIYGSANSVESMIPDLTERLHDSGWETYSLTPSGLGASDGDVCVAYDDFRDDQNGFVRQVRQWALEHDAALSGKADRYKGVMLVRKSRCP